MRRKTLVSIIIALLITIVVIGGAQAGSTVDFGQLTGIPAVGTINFYAWDNTTNLAGGIPSKILTEDNWLCSTGPNQGYFYNTNTALGPEGPTWAMTLYNLTNDYFTSRPISMVFGGLTNAERGHIWRFNFTYTQSPSIKNWGIIGTKSDNEPNCPVIYPVKNQEGAKVVSFFAQPNQTYQIYRSQNASGASNGYSNGVYLWVGSTITDTNGYAVYTDTTFSPTAPGWWYEVILVSSTGVNGCHSEPVETTAAVLSSFTSSFDLATTSVKLDWETVSDSSILGFDIYRSDEVTPDPVKINPEIVLVYEPGGMGGNQYSYIDEEVEFGQTYTYWIDVVDLEMLTSRYGPVTQSAGFKVFVPILQR